MTSRSSGGEKGIGTSSTARTVGGPRKASNASWVTRATISDAAEQVRRASSTASNSPVLRTESAIAFHPSGNSVRGSTTSTEIPSSSSLTAALTACLAISPIPAIVRSVPFTEHPSFAERDDEVLVIRHFASHSAQGPVVEEYDGVGVPNRGLEQTLGVSRSRRQDDLHAAGIHDDRMWALGVLRRHARAATGRTDEGQREVAGAPPSCIGAWPPG